jgi:hypothetical protein
VAVIQDGPGLIRCCFLVITFEIAVSSCVKGISKSGMAVSVADGVEVKWIDRDTELFQKLLELRFRTLREPLGMPPGSEKNILGLWMGAKCCFTSVSHTTCYVNMYVSYVLYYHRSGELPLCVYFGR